MPLFNYKARSTSGDLVEGSMEVADRAAAVAQIDRQGLFPVMVETAGQVAAKASPRAVQGLTAAASKEDEPESRRRIGRLLTLSGALLFVVGLVLWKTSGFIMAVLFLVLGPVFVLLGFLAKPAKPKPQALATYTQQLANLLNSGMPLPTALKSLESLETKGIPSSVTARLHQDVNEGKTVSVSMAAMPDIFPEMYVNMVRAGEQSGQMVEVLRRMADHYERYAEVRHKVTSAMVYPSFVIGVGMILVVFFMSFMLPRFMSIFDKIGGTLPTSTRILQMVSEVFSHWLFWLVILGGGALLAAIFAAWRKQPEGRRKMDGWMMQLPVLGRIVQLNLFSQFARTLGTLLRNGVPVLTALRITEDVVTNAVVRDAITNTREGVTDGKTIAQPLARSGVFPKLMVDMIHIGEQTGDVPGALENVAETFESDLNVALRVMTSLIEPVLIVVIALFVAFLLFGVLQALFTITSTIGR